MVEVAIGFYKKLGRTLDINSPGRSERPPGAGAVPLVQIRGENQEEEQVCFCVGGIWRDLPCTSDLAFKKEVYIHLGGVFFVGNSGLHSLVHRPEAL